MARILINKVWYEQVEPSTFSEQELEDRIVLHAPSVYPEYYVLPFKKMLETSLGNVTPDLVFISKDYKDWRIVEVEMGYHSYSGHIEQQIEKICDAPFSHNEAEYICQKNPKMDWPQVRDLITNKPPGVLIIINEPKKEWVKLLSKLGAIVAIFELFRNENEDEIFRVNGEYPIQLVNTISNCSFHPHIPRLLEVHDPISITLPPVGGKMKIRYNNCMTEWERLDAEGKIFLSPKGRNPLDSEKKYRIIRQSDNTLVINVYL